MSKTTDKPKCVGLMYGTVYDYICGKTATTEYEGKPYCKRHNPALKKERQRKRDEKNRREWESRQDRENARYAAEKERDRKAAAYDALRQKIVEAKARTEKTMAQCQTKETVDTIQAIVSTYAEILRLMEEGG